MKIIKYLSLAVISLYLLTFIFISLKYPETLVYVDNVPLTATVSDQTETIILDTEDGSGVAIEGAWATSSTATGYHQSNYLTDSNTDKGTKTVTFTPTLTGGSYKVYLNYPAFSNRATNVPIDIQTATALETITINQTQSGAWKLLGTYTFSAGTSGFVKVRTTGTTNYVIADAVKFVKQDTDTPPDPEPPTPIACTSHTYTTWSPATCPASGTQTRTITSSSPSGCTGGEPKVLTQSCTPPTPPVVQDKYYIRSDATGLNNGTDWTNAWKAFSDIDWNLIKPGDTIYISGGSSSLVYTGGLTIGKSGTASRPITIKVGQDFGNNGEVVLDGAGISMKMREYIVVDGSYKGANHLTVKNAVNGVYLDSNNIISYLNLYDNGYRDMDNGGVADGGNGIYLAPGADYFEIAYCNIKRNYTYAITQPSGPVASGYGHSKIHHNNIIDISFDGFKGGFINADVYDNEIGGRYLGGAPDAHLDIFQASNINGSLYTRIYNNHIFDFTNSVTYFEVRDGGTFADFIFYNNIIEKSEYGGSDQGIFVGRGSNITVRNVLIANNVFTNLDRQAISLGADIVGSNVGIANNIFINSGQRSGSSVLSFGRVGMLWSDISSASLNNNFIFSGINGTNQIGVAGLPYSDWSTLAWRSLYPQWSNNLNGNPDLNNSYYPISSSRVINAGQDLSRYLSIAPRINKDILGVSRSQGSAWDIGPYEYNSGTTPPPTPTCTTFTYSNWSTCSNRSQSRTILTSSPANCTGGSPVLTQSCSDSGNTGGGGGGGGGSSRPTATSTIANPQTVSFTVCQFIKVLEMIQVITPTRATLAKLIFGCV